MTQICSFYINSVYFDLETCLVKCDLRDIEVNLDSRSMDLMLCLAKGGSKGCSRDELLTSLWPDKVVSDDSLTNLISQTRAKLKPFRDSFIKTIPKKGYLLIGEVKFDVKMTDDVSLKDNLQTATRLENATSKATHNAVEQNVINLGSRSNKVVVGFASLVILFIILGLLKWLVFSDQSKSDRTIAIFPIKAFSQDSDVAVGAANFTDELTHQFTNYPGVLITSRIETERMLKTNLSLKEMSVKMHARYLIEGSVREIDNSIKITIQMVDGLSGLTVFSRIINASKEKFINKNEQIIQLVSRLVISEIPAGVSLKTGSKFDPKMIEAKCESYLGLARLYADSILEDVYSIAAPAENACISLAQIKFGDAVAESKIAELYVEMAIATKSDRNEKLSFINLGKQYLEKAKQSEDVTLEVFSVAARLHFLEIEDALNNGKNAPLLFEEALNNLSNGLKYFPQDLSLLNSKGEIYRNIGVSKRRHGRSPLDDFNVAEKAFLKVIQMDLNNEIVWSKIARLQMSTAAYFHDIGKSPMEKLQDSADSYQKASHINPKKPSYYLKRANALMVLGDLRAKDGKNPKLAFEQSAKSLKKAEDISPNLFGAEAAFADLYRRMAKVDFNKGLDASGLIEKGIVHGKKAIKINSGNVWAYFALMELHRTGYQFDFAKGKVISSYAKSCINIGQKGMAIKNDSARAWVSLLDCEQISARIFLESGENAAARQKLKSLLPLIENLIAFDIDYSYSYQIQGVNLLLLSLINGSMDFSKAIESFEKAQILNPSDHERKLSLLEAYLYQLNYDKNQNPKLVQKIQGIMKQLTSISFNNAEFHLQQAIFSELMGQTADFNAITTNIERKYGLVGKSAIRKYRLLLK